MYDTEINNALFQLVDVDAICVPNNPDYEYANSIHQFHVMNLKGEYVKLDIYKGYVCIIVNIASKSGFTALHLSQFNDLYKKYGEDKGLRILAFPCNQFGNEEPGSSDDIAEFALQKKITFDIFGKVDVNGNTSSDLWNFLKHTVSGKDRRGKNNMIKWSYNKFIITKDGLPVERYGSQVEPIALVKTLEQYW